MAKGAKGFLVLEGTPKPRKEQGALRPWDPLGMPCEIYLDEKTYLPVKILWKNIRKGKLRGVFALEYSKYQMGKKFDPALFKGPSEKEEITVWELPKGWHLKKGNGDKKGKERRPGKGKESKAATKKELSPSRDGK